MRVSNSNWECGTTSEHKALNTLALDADRTVWRVKRFHKTHGTNTLKTYEMLRKTYVDQPWPSDPEEEPLEEDKIIRNALRLDKAD
jgi:hypothetical protein